jgi:hypothetical protein
MSPVISAAISGNCMKGAIMKRAEAANEFAFKLSQSTTDSNRLYSILLDARASTAADSMYDIAEKILLDEKTNAKNALEQLWALKKNMQNGSETRTMDLLINYYQNKLDILRHKEEHIKKVSRESRDLLEEKRSKDAEIASVKQEIQDCSTELDKLNTKLAEAKTREQELILIDMQLKKELSSNENDVVNGLYEIILSHEVAQDSESREDQPATETPEAAVDVQATAIADAAATPAPVIEEKPKMAEIIPLPSPETTETSPIDLEQINQAQEIDKEAEQIHALYQQMEKTDGEGYPKSVVKTTRGVVIGEYFYDSKVYKNKRHYIFNSLYFMEQLTRATQVLKERHDQTIYSESLQMVQDAFKRVSGNSNLHFEVSTNEIINEKNLKDLWRSLKDRSYFEVITFCNRLRGKISALSNNYRIMLKEQMERYAQA